MSTSSEAGGADPMAPDAYRDLPVLVTGGAGAIGSTLTATLLGRGAQVVVVDDCSSGWRWNLPDHPALRFVDGDLLDDDVLASSFADDPQVVFHLAGFFANQNSVDHPQRDLLVNGLGTLRVYEAVAQRGQGRIVYSSTSSVYGGGDGTPVGEDAVGSGFTTPYQITKLLGEQYAAWFDRWRDTPSVVVRFFNSYGPGEVPGAYRNVIPNFIWKAMRGRPLTITGTGLETRDFTHVGDIVDGLLRCGAVPAAAGHTFNLARGRERTVADLADLVRAATGSDVPVELVERRSWDTKDRLVASTERARELLGFEGTVDLEDGLVDTVAWFRANEERLVRLEQDGAI